MTEPTEVEIPTFVAVVNAADLYWRELNHGDVNMKELGTVLDALHRDIERVRAVIQP